MAQTDATYRPRQFYMADKRMQEEETARVSFESGDSGRQQSEFDKIFGEDPLDYLMSQFALPIYEAETHRAEIERHGKVTKKDIPPPESFTFQELYERISQQWTERTCPAEQYFGKFLNTHVRNAIEHTFKEAENLRIADDHRTFKLFCPLDHIARHLWKNNPRHPERLQMDDQKIPIFKEYFNHFSRPEPSLHLKYTTEQAALVIQKHWKGTLTRRRPEIRALRKHIAAARIQYCDPRKLVEELWNRNIPPSHLSEDDIEDGRRLESESKRQLKPIPLRLNTDAKPPPLPAFLYQSKLLAEEAFRKSEDVFDRRPPSYSDSENEEADKPKAPAENAASNGSSASNSGEPKAGGTSNDVDGNAAIGNTRKSLLQGASATIPIAPSTPLPEQKASKDKQGDGTGKKPSKQIKTGK